MEKRDTRFRRAADAQRCADAAASLPPFSLSSPFFQSAFADEHN